MDPYDLLGLFASLSSLLTLFFIPLKPAQTVLPTRKHRYRQLSLILISAFLWALYGFTQSAPALVLSAAIIFLFFMLKLGLQIQQDLS